MLHNRISLGARGESYTTHTAYGMEKHGMECLSGKHYKYTLDAHKLHRSGSGSEIRRRKVVGGGEGGGWGGGGGKKRTSLTDKRRRR